VAPGLSPLRRHLPDRPHPRPRRGRGPPPRPTPRRCARVTTTTKPPGS
jgi:hypothetical protein